MVSKDAVLADLIFVCVEGVCPSDMDYAPARGIQKNRSLRCVWEAATLLDADIIDAEK